MSAAADLSSMRRTTPSSIANEVYEASLARRAAQESAYPAPRAAWRPVADPPILADVIRRAYADYLAARVTPEMRLAVAAELLVDIDRRYPPADMAVLERYGLTHVIRTAIVETASRHERLELPAARSVMISRTGHQPQIFTSVASRADERLALAPAPALPVFAMIDAAAEVRIREFEPALQWPAAFVLREKRRPIWSEIEEAWPRIGDWLRAQRAFASRSSPTDSGAVAPPQARRDTTLAATATARAAPLIEGDVTQ